MKQTSFLTAKPTEIFVFYPAEKGRVRLLASNKVFSATVDMETQSQDFNSCFEVVSSWHWFTDYTLVAKTGKFILVEADNEAKALAAVRQKWLEEEMEAALQAIKIKEAAANAKVLLEDDEEYDEDFDYYNYELK